MNKSASACGRLAARATACRVCAEASGPNAVSTTASGAAEPATRRATWLPMSRRWATPSIHALLLSSKPFGAGGRHSGSPRRLWAWMSGCASAGAGRAPNCEHPFARALELCARCAPGFGCSDQRFRHLPQVPIGLGKPLRQAINQGARRLVRDEMLCELGTDMVCGCGMARGIGGNRATLLDTRIMIDLSDHLLRSGLVHAPDEGEFGAMIRIDLRGNDSP